jgi:DNA end-binding protein Ku
VAARALWKGVIHASDARLAVKLYSAVEDRRVHLRLLHAEDHVPVRQVMVRPGTDEPVPPERIRKGYEVEPGVFVLLEEEELEGLEPEPSRSIEISRFVPSRAIDHRWYDRPYRLAPDGDTGAYAAMARALAEERRLGVAHWVMRKRPYVGALHSTGRGLALVTLRHVEEVISPARLEAPPGREASRKELAMARQLVEALAGEPELDELSETYEERLLELIERKARGGEIVRPEVETGERRKGSLAESLKASLEALEERRSA